MTAPDTLSRFLEAQASAHAGFEMALAELRAGRKRSHWIWYVFPQLRGLGLSPMAERFGLGDVAEARSYLAHPVLGDRLRQASEAVAAHLAGDPERELGDIMGADVDARKLVSSMTLFGRLATRLSQDHPDGVRHRALADAAHTILKVARRQKLPPCAFTLDRLRSEPEPPGP